MAKRQTTAPVTLISTEELHRELQRREKSIERLQKKRDKMAAELAEVDAELLLLRGLSAVSRKHPKNDMTLVEALQKVLRDKTLSVTEAAEAVQKAGYRSSSKTFRLQVNQALLANTKLFKKVSRGQYRGK